MAATYKVLGQAFPDAYILTPVYICPVGKSAIISTIDICNQANSLGEFRISVAVNNATDSRKQYLYYDEDVRGKSTFSATQGWTLKAGDVIRAFGTGQMSFNLFGCENDI
jgi:hypothetical protein